MLQNMPQKTITTICFDILGVCIQDKGVDENIQRLIVGLKQQSLRVIAYTNSWRGSIQNIDKQTPFLTAFDAVYYADTLGPKNPQGYTLLARAEHMQPQQCLIIDDTEENINSAEEAGFPIYHFQTQHKNAALKLSDFLQTIILKT